MRGPQVVVEAARSGTSPVGASEHRRSRGAGVFRGHL